MALVIRQPNEPSGEPYAGHKWQVWMLSILIGAVSGLAGVGLLKLLHFIERIAYDHGGSFLEAVQSTSGMHRVVVMLIAGLITGLGGIFFRQYVAGHSGGLTEAIWFHNGRFPLPGTLSRAVLSIVVVGIGASLGREGALKQTGASIASSLSDWFHLTDPQRRLLAACGAAGGFAAAYNVPFGAALFSLEVLLGMLSVELAGPVLLCSVIAALCSNALQPSSVTYEIPHYTLNAALIAWCFLIGPLLGFVGAAYVRAFSWMEAIEPKKYGGVWMPVFVLTGLGILAIPFPQLLGNGKDVVHLALLGQFPMHLLIVLPALKFMAIGMCAGSGVPGGLFTPTLSVGALIGGLLGGTWTIAWPGTPSGPFALVGMAALLSGTTHGPISTVVLVTELTGDWHLVPLLLLACSSATVVARWMDARTVYTARLQRRMHQGLAAARDSIEGGAEFLSKAVELIPSAAHYITVASRLGKLKREDVLFVLDDRGRLLGEIRSEELEKKVTRLGSPRVIISAGDIAEPSPKVFTTEMAFSEMRESFLASHIDCVPVIDRENRLVGVITRKSLEEA